ncbi:MAG: accessory gene regulator ArgB-like protein [Bacillota bacterium]|jgi:accessory gene regulator B|nr:accessory regulator AgrB [Clostridia bacterium]
MSYSKFSTNIAKYISNEINLDDEKKQIIAYAIDSLLLSILGFLLIVFFGALFGAALPAAITSLSGGFLRRLSGGAHAETPMKCMLYSSLGYGIVSVAGYYVSKTIAINNIYLLAVLGFCLLIVARYAPVDCPAKPIHSPVLRKRLKVGSICFILGIMFLVIFLDLGSIEIFLTLGVLVQSLTLFPFLNKN